MVALRVYIECWDEVSGFVCAAVAAEQFREKPTKHSATEERKVSEIFHHNLWKKKLIKIPQVIVM